MKVFGLNGVEDVSQQKMRLFWQLEKCVYKIEWSVSLGLL
jgi:hypothetical protein